MLALPNSSDKGDDVDLGDDNKNYEPQVKKHDDLRISRRYGQQAITVTGVDDVVAELFAKEKH